MGSRFIGHLDADSFYVSAERVRDEFLIGKPVGVLGNNGACVIARSYEMKATGVRTGEPIWDAVKKCPEGIYVKRDFRWYEVLSRQMLEVATSLCDRLEYYSIDEFFFELEGDSPNRMLRRAEAIRDEIKAKTRLPVTVGIARSRSIAKLMTDTFKPFGARAILTRKDEEDLLREMPVTALCGIASRRASRLVPYNVRSCLDFCKLRKSLVRQLLTITGENLWRELNGEAVTPIQSERPAHQTISRGGSIGWSTDDATTIHAWLVRNLERLIEELDFHQVRVGKLCIWLSHKDSPDTLGEVTLDTPTDRFDLLLDAAKEGLKLAWFDQKVTHMHLVASHLKGPGPIQRTLFEPPPGRHEAIAQLKREINGRIGRFSLRSGATLPLYQIYRDESCNYDICDVHGKICF
jgi:nucleotidyltransferase/DNA polymerase involved in DNA repair